VVAGRSTSDGTFEELSRAVEVGGLVERVRLLRDLRHPDAVALLQRAEVFVLPSRTEGFAVALLEAGALERPVVATAICGVEELIENERDGLVIAPDDAPALAAAMRRMLREPQTAQRLAASLHRRVVVHFTWRRAAHQYLSLLGAPDGPRPSVVPAAGSDAALG
jgi:glycogen(starch) synthase